MATDFKRNAELPTVAEYYAGKNIFITGGTGSVGKVLIEKLLRSCPHLNRIYVLIRPKRSQDIRQRLEKLFSYPIFDSIKQTQPDYQRKIIPIAGDLHQLDIGISDMDRQALEENVHIVFHSAATVRFDDPIRVAVEMNVLGVRKMINLCKRFKQLDAFVHVSTAYSNCDRPMIEEKVYPTTVESQKVIDLLDWMDDAVLDSITPYLIGNKPNTYTFTKHLGEDLLIKEGSMLPLAIVRPSIVGASWKEPLPGWIDNYNGPVGLYVAIGKGILQSFECDSNALVDFVPVDITVNMLVAVAWYAAIRKPENVSIYHCTSGTVNPLTWGEIDEYAKILQNKAPLEDAIRLPYMKITTNRYLHKYRWFVQHVVPAFLMDMALSLAGKNPRMINIYKRVGKVMDCLTYFTTHSWEWTYTNLDMLVSQMSPEDRKMFYFDTSTIDWWSYMQTYYLGIKKYLLKEDMANLPAARARLRNLRNIGYIFNCFLVLIVCLIFWWIFNLT